MNSEPVISKSESKLLLPKEDKRFAPTIPGEFVFDVLQAYCHRGGDSKRLLEALGFDVHALHLPGNRVSVIDYATLVERVIMDLGDGCLGFIDQNIPIRAFSVFACQISACENVEQMIQQVNRFYGLFTRQLRLEVCKQSSEARIVLHFEETQSFDYRFIYQSILVMIVRLISWFIGAELEFRSIRFSFKDYPRDQHLQYLFDCPVYFDCSENEICLDLDLLTYPCSTTIGQVQEMLRDSRWMMLIRHKSSPFTRSVRKSLILSRETRWPGIEEVAQQMNLSKNLLWRKLKKENTSFLEIRDEVKRDYVLSLISDLELTVSDLAVKAGYADVSALNKAFVKWTGQSPSRFRDLYKDHR